MTAQGVSAAGVAVLYTAVLAGTVLYKLIIRRAGFSLLALITAAGRLRCPSGMDRRGRSRARGGFFTPYFIGVVSASPARLFIYLLLLQGGLIIVTRRRQWTGLAALTLVMGLGAAFMRVAGETAVQDAPWVGLFLLVSTAAFVLSARGFKTAPPSGEGFQAKLPSGPSLAMARWWAPAFLGVAALAAMTRFALEEWLFVGILALASLVLGRLDRAHERCPGWGSRWSPPGGGRIIQSPPKERASVWIVSAGLGLIFGLGGWIAGLGARTPRRGPRCPLPSQASWPSAEHGGWTSSTALPSSIGVWVSLAGAILATCWRRSGRPSPHGAPKTGKSPRRLLRGGNLLRQPRRPLELSSQWLSVAWALEAAALAWLLLKLRVEGPRAHRSPPGGWRLRPTPLNPSVLDYPLGDLPVLNWILYGCGISALAFGLAAWWYDRARWERSAAAAAFTWGRPASPSPC